MHKITLRQETINDLADIWFYTFSEWSEKQAEKYYNAIKNAVNELLENSSLWKVYIEIYSDLLGYKVGKHIIFFKIISENEIEIIRILHEKMDFTSKFE